MGGAVSGGDCLTDSKSSSPPFTSPSWNGFMPQRLVATIVFEGSQATTSMGGCVYSGQRADNGMCKRGGKDTLVQPRLFVRSSLIRSVSPPIPSDSHNVREKNKISAPIPLSRSIRGQCFAYPLAFLGHCTSQDSQTFPPHFGLLISEGPKTNALAVSAPIRTMSSPDRLWTRSPNTHTHFSSLPFLVRERWPHACLGFLALLKIDIHVNCKATVTGFLDQGVKSSLSEWTWLTQ